MTRQVINVGATANDGTGDGLRTAYIKCNDNFKSLFDTTVTPTEIINGTSNIAVADSANVTISIAGSANVTSFGLQETTIGGNVTIATDLNIGNSLTITQDFTIGDQLIINGSVGSNILPDTNNARVLGNTTLRFAETNTVLVSASGNITSGANIAGANIIATQDVIIAGQHITTGNVTSSGNISGGNLLTGGRVVATGNLVTSGDVVASANITGLNITATGSANVTAGGFFIGDGGFLSNVTSASNVAVTQIANGTSIVGISSSGGNVELTSGGTLAFQTNGTNLDVIIPITSANITAATGNISGGNILTGGLVSATGNVTSSANISAVNFIGNGSFLTGIDVDAAGISNGTSNVTVANNSDTTVVVAGSTILTVSATGSATTGNVTATGNIAGGNAIITGDVTGATITGNGSALSALNGSNITTGTVAAARVATLNQNTTGSAATLTTPRAIEVSGAVTGTANFDGSAAINIVTTNTADPTITLAGDLSGSVTLTNLASGTLTATITKDPVITLTGDVTGSGTMTNLDSVSFATTIAANSVALGTDTTGNYVATGAVSGTGLSGSSSSEGGTFTVTSNATSANTASTIIARDGSGDFSAGIATLTATQARYADIAEQYLADQEYEPGTVVCIGGVYEITSCGPFNTPAGVISTDPALLMNSELNAGLPVALLGRVPVRVFGPVTKGQKVYADLHGRACRSSEGELIGIALEDNADEGEKLVECMLKL